MRLIELTVVVVKGQDGVITVLIQGDGGRMETT